MGKTLDSRMRGNDGGDAAYCGESLVGVNSYEKQYIVCTIVGATGITKLTRAHTSAYSNYISIQQPEHRTGKLRLASGTTASLSVRQEPATCPHT